MDVTLSAAFAIPTDITTNVRVFKEHFHDAE